MFPDTEGDYFRNRLTHSIEVAQIAKSIAIKINSDKELPFFKDPIDTDLIELVSLAHDLGHPPFGHEGEAQLDDCMKRFGGFEGNAQTLRLLAKIEKKERIDPEAPLIDNGNDNRAGLNLTFRSLAGVLKYDQCIPMIRTNAGPPIKGYYQSEQQLVDKIKKHLTGGLSLSTPFKTIECQIMDIADDIAYSTYDLDDALKSGLFNILDMLALPESSAEKIASKASRSLGKAISKEDVWEALVSIIGSQKVFSSITEATDFDSNNIHTVAMALGWIHRSTKKLASDAYLRNAFTSHLVGEFVRSIKVDVNSECLAFSKVYLEDDIWLKVEVLKHLAFQFLIGTPRWKLSARRSRDIVKYIFEALTKEGGHEIMPEDFRNLYVNCAEGSSERYRIVCDYISCMTDSYAVELYARLQSDRPTDFFKQH
tara:strand:+ start:646 stop:1920 length:1275 start_codon:yes stop_codon:yes gene_type:complete